MQSANHSPRPLLRLNSRAFEAFVRGTPRCGRIDLLRKLDAAPIASGDWQLTGTGLRVRLRIAPTHRGAVDAAARELKPLILAIKPRILVDLQLSIGRQRIMRSLSPRGPLLSRRGADSSLVRNTRLALAAVVDEVPVDYAQQRQLRPQPEAQLLAFAGIDVSRRECWLDPRACARWRQMRLAAASDGVELQLVSGFRSATYQARIFERKRGRGESMQQILRINAAPGFSEHHTGHAVDLTAPGFAPIEESFETSAAFTWLNTNAARFRLRLSYPRGNPHGITYEPWHWYFE